MYEKALKMQLKPEVIQVLNKLLQSAENLTLEEKLKNPNSMESKMLAIVMASIAATQWLEAAIAKLNAELHYLEELIKKEQSRKNHVASSDFTQTERPKEEKVEKPVRITELYDRLATVTTQMNELKEHKKQLEEQHEAAKEALREIHGQALSQMLGTYNLVVNREAVESFNQLNEQQAKPFSMERVIASYEAAAKEEAAQAKAAGLPPPPPTPQSPRKLLGERTQQARNTGRDSALVSIVAGIFRENPDTKRTSSNIQSAQEILPVIRALSMGQVEGWKELDRFFEQKYQHVDGMIRDVEGQRNALEVEIRRFASSLLSPSLTPSFGSERRLSEEEEKLAELLRNNKKGSKGPATH